MPRALLLCEHSTLNGGERSLLAVLPHLMTAGWSFAADCPTHGPLAERFALLGVPVVAAENAARPATIDDRRRRLRQVLQTGVYDLVHANSLAMGRMSGPVAQAAGIPSIAHLRDIVKLNATAVADLNAHRRLLAVSEAVRTYHAVQGLAIETTFVLHNGIDLAKFRPTPPTGNLHRELGLPPSARLIGVVGQIILRKGHDTALPAALEVMQSRPDVHLLVVGTRHSDKPETVVYERRLYATADRAGLAGRVHFLGTRDDMPRLYPELTMLLHAARQEPLGRVLLEAAACGVPIAATDVGGTREIFPAERDDGAILFAVDDTAAAARACAAILDDAALAQVMQCGGRRRTETAFTLDAAAGGLLRHYETVSRRA